MPKSASIHARIEPELKEAAEAILKELGLNATQAITLFYNVFGFRFSVFGKKHKVYKRL